MPVSRNELYRDISDRIAVTKTRMVDEGFDALIVFGNAETHSSLRYLTDFYPDHGTTMVTADQTIRLSDGAALFFTPDSEPILLLEPGLVVPREIHTEHVVAGGWDPDSDSLTADTLIQYLTDEGVSDGTVGIETLDRFPHPLFAGIDDGLPDVTFVESRIVEKQRYTKTETELRIIEEASGLAERVHEIVVDELRDGNYRGKSELDVVHAVEAALIDENPGYTTKKGPEYMNNGNPIEHAHYYHGRRSEEFTDGTVFTWDLPQHYMGYYVDTSRTRIIGGPTDRQQRGFDAAREAYDEIIDMARPGVNSMDLVNRYHDILNEHGFEAPFGGLLGHGVGLEIHERPDMVLDEMELQEDMILAIEPRALVDDAVIGLEDMIRVTPSGGDVLTGFERDTLTV